MSQTGFSPFTCTAGNDHAAPETALHLLFCVAKSLLCGRVLCEVEPGSGPYYESLHVELYSSRSLQFVPTFSILLKL